MSTKHKILLRKMLNQTHVEIHKEYRELEYKEANLGRWFRINSLHANSTLDLVSTKDELLLTEIPIDQILV